MSVQYSAYFVLLYLLQPFQFTTFYLSVDLCIEAGDLRNNNNNNNNNGLYCTDKLHIMCYNITMYKSKITIQSSRELKNL